MRQVDSCDFCGDAPDGVFEVVPAAVPDGPVRLALCADCRTTLESVVDPLLAADAGDGASRDRDVGSDRQSVADDGAAADGPGDTAPASTDDGAASAPNAPTAMRESPADTESGAAAADPAADSGGGDDGITIEGQGGGSDGSGSGDRSAPAERPDGYAQVLRLLENRDGGMPRSDLRALATNAYDLTDASFEAAVDAALDNGDVEEGAGGLRRT
jgi:hypothetical protein